MDLYYDDPITDASEDLYGRVPLAKRCAEILESIRSDKAYVLGLSGTWGSGKTSFLKLVRNELQSGVNKQVVIEFNPWLYASHEQLIREYFEQLRTALGVRKDGKLGKLLIQYADAIASEGVTALSLVIPQLTAVNAVIPFANSLEAFVIRRVLQKAGEMIGSGEKTIVQLRDEISEVLAERNQNIVVIIDDVDRLESGEIRLLFKLVNSTASFPRITYILSYDSDVVTAALSEVQGIDGALYLEKIVQLPLELPPLTKDDIRLQLSTRLDPYIASQKTFRIEGGERSRLLQVFEKLVLNRIVTPRQVKRYLDKFEASLLSVGDEICPTDMIGMVGLRLFCPSTTQWLIDHREDVCSGSFRSLHFDESYYAGLKGSLSAVLAEEMKDSAQDVKDALSLLFPKTEWSGSRLSNIHLPSVSRETGRVANLENFQRFIGLIDSDAVSREFLYHLTMASNIEELMDGLVDLSLKGQLGRFSEFAQSERYVLGSRKEIICKAVLGSIGSIKQDEIDGFFQWSDAHKLSVLLSDLLKDIGSERADALVISSMEQFSAFDYIGLGWFLRDERLAHTEKQSNGCLSDDAYDQLSSRYVDVVVDNWPSVLRMPRMHSKYLWRAIDEDKDGKALIDVRQRYGDDMSMRVLSMACALSHWTSGSGDGYSIGEPDGGTYEPILDTPTAEEVELYSKDPDYWRLPDDVKIRVSALYILLTGEDTDEPDHGAYRATSTAAEKLLEEWYSVYSH